MPLHQRGGARPNAGRKSGWSTSDTTTIRIPRKLAKQLIEIAKQLDSHEEMPLSPKQRSLIENTIAQLQEILREDSLPKAPIVDCSDDWVAIEGAMAQLGLTWDSPRITAYLEAASKRSGKPAGKKYLSVEAIKALRDKLEGAIAN